MKVEVKSSNLSDLGFDLIGNCDHDATRINQVSVTMPYHIDILNSIHPEGAKDREVVGVTK